MNADLVADLRLTLQWVCPSCGATCAAWRTKGNPRADGVEIGPAPCNCPKCRREFQIYATGGMVSG